MARDNHCYHCGVYCFISIHKCILQHAFAFFFFFSGREGICHKKVYYFVNLPPPHTLWMSVLSIAA